MQAAETADDLEQRDPGYKQITSVEVKSREQFLKEWDYGPGQHLTMLGPTQRGKTHLCQDLLSTTISPDHQCVILSGKIPNRDVKMNDAARRLNLRVVESWPPPMRRVRDRNKNGYVLRPHQGLKNLDEDHENLRTQFRAVLMGNYASQVPVITVVDEAHHVQNDLKLRKEYEAPLMRGAPVNAVWSLVQRGRFMTYHVYDAPEHLFIFYDPDRSNQMRYAEIGGVDPRVIQSIVAGLNTYKVPVGKTHVTISECLYIRRSGPELCIVDVK